MKAISCEEFLIQMLHLHWNIISTGRDVWELCIQLSKVLFFFFSPLLMNPVKIWQVCLYVFLQTIECWCKLRTANRTVVCCWKWREAVPVCWVLHIRFYFWVTVCQLEQMLLLYGWTWFQIALSVCTWRGMQGFASGIFFLTTHCDKNVK